MFYLLEFSVVIVDRNSDIMGTINMLIDEMRAEGMEVYYRDWVGIIQGYSSIYKSQVGAVSKTVNNNIVYILLHYTVCSLINLSEAIIDSNFD